MNRDYDLIVFDWDGTLMDSTAHIVRSIQAACVDLGLPVPSRERASYVIGLGLTDAMRYACPGLEEARYHEMVDAYRRHYLAGDAGVDLFEGVAEALREYKEQGVFLAVATGKSRVGLDRVLALSGLDTVFDCTRTVDECHSKPHPQMLEQITDYLGVAPQRALMIGDTTHDLQMALNAGVPSVGVSYGAHPESELLALNPVACFACFGELHPWLRARIN